jgi:diguanylate cyclase (GGDEF)-like protein
MSSSSIKPYSYFLFPLPLFILAFQAGAFDSFLLTLFTLFLFNFGYLLTHSPRFFEFSLLNSPLPSFLILLSGLVATSLSSLSEKILTDKSRKIKEEEEKVRRYAALDKIIGAERHFEDLNSLLKFILSQLKKPLKARIFYLKEEDKELILLADEKEGKLKTSFIPRESWIYQTFASKTSSLYPSPANQFQASNTEPFKNSFLLLSPVLEEEKILGAFLAVRSFGEPPFTLEELEFLGIASHHFRALIKEAEFREDLRKSVKELSAIAKIAEASISTLNLEKLLEVSLEAAAKALHAHSGSIFLSRNDQLKLAKTFNLKIKPYTISQKNESGSEIAQLVKKEKKYLHLVNPLPPGFKSLHPEITDSLVLPLLAKEDFIGILCLNNQTPRKYTESEIRTAFTIANELALAIKTTLLHQETLEKSLTDQLTGLRNHAYFWERLEEEVKRARRSKKPLSILIFDLDNFKVLNDTYGHLKGDEILKEVGKAVKETIRGSDIPARYGGDEFAVIMPETKVENSVRLAKRLAARINQLRYGNLSLTLSIGLASYPEHGKSAVELIEQADLALYSVKRQGKNDIMVARSPA